MSCPAVFEILRSGRTPEGLRPSFADIRGFTAISEAMDPSQVASLLNSFRSLAEQAITANGGVIDKFIGDGPCLLSSACQSPQSTDATSAITAATTLAATVEKWKP